MSVCVLESDSELEEIIEEYVIVYFTATWCGPCRQISPHYARAAEENSTSQLKFSKVDVDDLESSHVSAIPTFRVYKNSSVVDELVGADLEALQTLIKQHCAPF